MYKLSFLGILILFTISYAGCSKTDLIKLGDFETQLDKEVMLESGLILKATKVEDSRCPVDAVCVWQGQALVSIALEYQGTMETIQIAKCNGESSLCEKETVEILEHKIQLLEVSPYPVLDVVVPDEDYILMLRVTKR